MIVAIVASDVAPWLALAGSLGAAVAIVRSVQVKSTLEVIREANDELRKVIDDDRKAREKDQLECNRQLAELSGKLTVLTGDFGRSIAVAIIDEWRRIDKEKA